MPNYMCSPPEGGYNSLHKLCSHVEDNRASIIDQITNFTLHKDTEFVRKSNEKSNFESFEFDRGKQDHPLTRF